MKVIEKRDGKPGGAVFFLPELDILRFFAFLLVFCHHAYPFDKYPATGTVAAAYLHRLAFAGGSGVDLFFLLSAFLITEILRREKIRSGTLDLPAFYMRRILRIWPLYFFALAIYISVPFLLSFLHMDVRGLSPLGPAGTLAFLCFLGNWYCVVHGFPHSPAGVLWSVSIEEQYYLVWPLLQRAWSRTACIRFVVAVWASGACLRAFLAARGHFGAAISTNTLARIDPIAVGVLLALFLKGRIPRMPEWLRFLGIGVALGLLPLTALVTDYSLVRFPALAYMACYEGAVVLMLLMFVATIGMSRALANSMLGRCGQYLGRISYGLYVWHVLALPLSAIVVDKLHLQNVAGARPMLGLILTIAMASVSYRLLEAPFLKVKRRFSHVLSAGSAPEPTAEPVACDA